MPKKKLSAGSVIDKLHSQYDEPKIELENWTNPIELMVAVILSAQATDIGVNKVTSKLFQKYKSVEDFANADLEELKPYISSINYYKTKAERIIKACRFVVDNYDGKLPPDINKLIKIPGIGRKSANVILHEGLNNSQGIVVDTHITRVSHRLRLTSHNNQKDAEKIETELKDIVPKNEWKFYSSAVVLHGRYVCKAKNPKCGECVLNDVCPSAFTY
jgi:endonuclease III